jgi:hypothetical protein
MGLSRLALHTSRTPFQGTVLGAAATPVNQITLVMTFGTQENFHTGNLQFEVADYETTPNVFPGLPALTKFMTIPHYTYLVLRIPGPHSVISIRGDVKHTYNCDKESYKMADRLMTSAEH